MGFFQESRDFNIYDSTFSDVHGNQNVNNHITNHNERDCGNTTIHNVTGSYNNSSVSDNSYGHVTNINNGPGPFFARPQHGYYQDIPLHDRRSGSRIRRKYRAARRAYPGSLFHGEHDEASDSDEEAGYEHHQYRESFQSMNFDHGYAGRDPIPHTRNSNQQEYEAFSPRTDPAPRSHLYGPNNPFAAPAYRTRPHSNPLPAQRMDDVYATRPLHPHHSSEQPRTQQNEELYSPQPAYASGWDGQSPGQATSGWGSDPYDDCDRDRLPRRHRRGRRAPTNEGLWNGSPNGNIPL